ncbi:serine/threonine protein phosphatase 2A 55 kDa regulatory subunit B beta isoform-like [Coffea arabica]|nr:serine/threonine protein phosphatase 2A 55 kDa regulatory subunit B beta isoform-like [Coffea arabica]
MTLSSISTPHTTEWKFSQVFGEPAPGEDVQQTDIISAIEFEKGGDYVAVGDHGGRVVIFEKRTPKDDSLEYITRNELEQNDFMIRHPPNYQYKTEFQSHEPEFDYLKSLEIEEKINKVRWCMSPNGSLFILSTNDRTVKLWKVKESKVKKVKEMDLDPFVASENSLLAEKSFSSIPETTPLSNGVEWADKTFNGAYSSVSHTKVPKFEDSPPARCRKAYAHAHDFNINSTSNNSDGETFLSADDFRVNLWNLEISDQCFNIIDMKPPNMEDLTEVITSAEFHPFHCNLLAYSSSRGYIRLVDMRKSAICDQSSRILHDGASNGSKSFFTEIVASISDLKFASNGRHILSRDYMSLKLWDIHMENSPVATYKIHEHLRPKLSDLYNNDALFDKFACCLRGDGLQFATGSYSNQVHIFSHGGGVEDITFEASKNPNRKPLMHANTRARRRSLSNLTRAFSRHGQENLNSEHNEFYCNLNAKLLHLAWHPNKDLIACAAGSSVFMHYLW